jgi:CBS domain-containing protein
MKAREIMTCHAISIGPDLPVQAVAKTLFENGISAMPVVGHDGKLLGIVSEGDLLHRVETGTLRRRSWWLEFLMSGRTMANEFVKSHGLKARDVMTSSVITAGPDTPLSELATLMERHGIKRIPIVEKNQIIGIVSRANMIQAIASGASEVRDDTDEALRVRIVSDLDRKPWGHGLVNVIVTDGKVDLWGVVDSEEEKNAVRVVAERATQGGRVNDNLRVYPMSFAS